MYQSPPIAWHHDLSQSAFDTIGLPRNVGLVTPFIRTGRGEFSVVQAFQAALKLLYTTDDPDWFCLLSGADYPAARADVVLKELELANCDAFLDVHQLDNVRPQARVVGKVESVVGPPGNSQPVQDQGPFLQQGAAVATSDQESSKAAIRKAYVSFAARGTVVLILSTLACFGVTTGSLLIAVRPKPWLAPTTDRRRLERHLKRRAFPEETYYQTVLCSSRGLTICRDNRRFAVWNGGGAHPMTLTDAEVPAILASGAHFARKFAPNSPALDALDHVLFP